MAGTRPGPVNRGGSAAARSAARGFSVGQTLVYKGPVGGDSRVRIFFLSLSPSFGNPGGAIVQKEGRGGDSALQPSTLVRGGIGCK